jgi:hypothetical protein
MILRLQCAVDCSSKNTHHVRLANFRVQVYELYHVMRVATMFNHELSYQWLPVAQESCSIAFNELSYQWLPVAQESWDLGLLQSDLPLQRMAAITVQSLKMKFRVPIWIMEKSRRRLLLLDCLLRDPGVLVSGTAADDSHMVGRILLAGDSDKWFSTQSAVARHSIIHCRCCRCKLPHGNPSPTPHFVNGATTGHLQNPAGPGVPSRDISPHGNPPR